MTKLCNRNTSRSIDSFIDILCVINATRDQSSFTMALLERDLESRNLPPIQYFCNGFIDFMLKSKSLLDYTNLFFPNEYEKNDKIILKYIQ